MAHYDDWVYDRGLENESWVHDRWGNDDDDDYYYDEDEEEEETVMSENRISFDRTYTDAERLIIDTKISRIERELKQMNAGPCGFQLNNEITCIYSKALDNEFQLSFKYCDSNNMSFNNYSAKSLFIMMYDSRIRQELLMEKKAFDASEKSVFKITYSREDGIDTVLKAQELGMDVDIESYLSLPDLTEQELLTFVSYGYGYDLVLEENTPADVKRSICMCISGCSYLRTSDEPKANAWIAENPDKCMLAKNRKRKGQ